MKIKLFLSVCLIVTLSAKSFSQLSFSVSPGLAFNSASFGYSVNNQAVLFAGLQYGGLDYDYEADYEDGGSYDEGIKGRMFVPNIGVKYYLLEKEKLKAYGSLAIAKPMVSGKVSSESEAYEDRMEEQIKSLKMWAGELGFGTEYFFDDNFSLGGEFGLRYFRLRSNYEYEYNEMEEYDIELDTKLKLSPTYTKISLNFYF